jgi:hypothetical protein
MDINGKNASMEILRLNQLVKCIPNIWKYKRVLYIGANIKRFFFRKALEEHKMDITVLEKSKERCFELEKLYPNIKIINMDVKDIESLTFFYDSVWWFHGPTMLYRKDAFESIKIVETKGKLIMLSTPWGEYKVGRGGIFILDGNKFPMYEKDFWNLGYHTDTIGKKDVNGSNLLAWKYNDEIRR